MAESQPATLSSPWPARIRRRLIYPWQKFWLGCSSERGLGRFASWLAALFAPPYHARVYLSRLHERGFISYRAQIFHKGLRRGRSVFIDDDVIIMDGNALGGSAGTVELHDEVVIYRNSILETGAGGSISVGAGSSIHPGCQLKAYVQPIRIGCGVMIAANCAFYSYDHSVLPGQPIIKQPLVSKGPIEIGDDSWVGTGATILSGVKIGAGAIVGAGAVVTKDVPDNAIAVGNPARVVKNRKDLV